MTPPEVLQALNTLTVLIDTREQDTAAFRRRVKMLDLPHKRITLSYGDYTASVLVDGEEKTLESQFVIERKMSLDELANNYTRGRKRFEREFGKAKNNGARVYLLVEHGELEKMFAGNYRSKLNPASLVASVFAWMPRYQCIYLPCKPENTPAIIREICHREAKQFLEEYDATESRTNQGTA